MKRMMRKAGTLISPDEGKQIFEFVVYDSKTRKKALYDKKKAEEGEGRRSRRMAPPASRRRRGVRRRRHVGRRAAVGARSPADRVRPREAPGDRLHGVPSRCGDRECTPEFRAGRSARSVTRRRPLARRRRGTPWRADKPSGGCQVTHVPDHVLFSHRRHVDAGASRLRVVPRSDPRSAHAGRDGRLSARDEDLSVLSPS